MGQPIWHSEVFFAIPDRPCGKNSLPIATAIAAVILLLYGCSERSLKPPAVVSHEFFARYPNTSATWTKQPYGYEGIFYQNGVEYEAEFSVDGRWLETEHEVSAVNFSQAVIDRVKRDYPGSTITKHEIEQTQAGTFYEVEIEQSGSEYELYFDSSAAPASNANEDS
ncbi:PepSY-like domain-containing protein [Leptolyngbya ohadii]|uniref:PepSY-like domain-containing protein n=1 Tax=Leptolyngbya ohadii TaxID=1962290 RepID=UPI000B5A17F4|nr:PepSY-like domain-containing protein [Leptolyngbya ohadii]